ncbi:hypothetical protein BDZ91DRAFT_776554 [Kalaharituber pfeilii]|nr:hypothetical protein BDZ91DRAFT_776554 [Kalaharituber pfeilii]
MLEVSTREQKEQRRPSPGAAIQVRIWRAIANFYSDWIYEPMATTLRFAHLVIIFVPVIVAIPIMFMGERVPEKSNERTGTLWWYVFLVNSMERAGPTFIKLGQWAASRSDIFPTQMCELMSRLHSNVDAHSLSATKRIIEDAFCGLPFEEIFLEFDETPLGIGAIAQVYKAKLHPALLPPNSEEEKQGFRGTFRHNVDVIAKSSPRQVPSMSVAIKVLHPGVENMVQRDLRIMHFFATVINAIPTMEWLSLPDEVTKFGEMMRLQLDLRIEGNNLVRFRKNFKNRSTVTFPKPYLDYTTKNVLIEEFAHGIPLSAFMEMGGGVFQKDIANMGLDAFLHMLLLDNFIHADLHPGNIMIRFYKPEKLDLLSLFFNPLQASTHIPQPPLTTSQNDVTEVALARLRPHIGNPKAWNEELAALDKELYQPQLIFIDTGLVTELNAVNRRNFIDLFHAIAEFDGYRAGHLMISRSRQPDVVRDPEIFALKMQHLILGVKAKTFALGAIKIGDLLSEALAMVRTHHVRLEGDFVNVVIGILLLEGIGRSLNPDLDLCKTSLPMLRQLGAQTAQFATMKGQPTTAEDEGPTSLGEALRSAWPMVKVWLALETREFLQTSVEDVERCVKYDLLSPNV